MLASREKKVRYQAVGTAAPTVRGNEEMTRSMMTKFYHRQRRNPVYRVDFGRNIFCNQGAVNGLIKTLNGVAQPCKHAPMN